MSPPCIPSNSKTKLYGKKDDGKEFYVGADFTGVKRACTKGLHDCVGFIKTQTKQIPSAHPAQIKTISP